MSRLHFLSIFVFSIIFLALFFNRGFAYYDEGFILQGAQRILQGELPYRDFDLIYTPGTLFLVSAVFKLFGESILVGRLLTLLVGAFTATLIYFITKGISKNKLVSLFSALIYLSWGPSHVNFPWPTLFAFSTGLLVAFFLEKNPFAAGVMTFVVFLFKQNFGMATLIMIIMFFALMGKKGVVGEIKVFFYGLALAGFAFISYFILTNSLIQFFRNIYFYSIKEIIFKGAFSTVFPGGIKSFFYLLPGLISLTGVFIAYKRQRKNIIFPLYTLFFFIFGIRPTTDYVHFTFLMASTGIPLSILVKINRDKLKLIVVYAVVMVTVFLGFYTAIFKNYYRWDSPLIKQNYSISNLRAKIFVDKKFRVVIPEIVTFVNQNSKKDDYIFVFYNASMFYFLTDRRNPTRYINFSPDMSLGEKREKEIVKNLREKNVKLVITHETPESWGNPLIAKYIVEKFTKKKEIFEFTVWEKD